MTKPTTFAIPLLAIALAAPIAKAETYAGNQGRSWADIAKLPPITGIYESAPQDSRKDGQRDLLPVLTPKAAAEQAATRPRRSRTRRRPTAFRPECRGSCRGPTRSRCW